MYSCGHLQHHHFYLFNWAFLQDSRCIVLHNMITPEEVDDELEEEVTGECGKFGLVEKVVIYQEPSHTGDVVKIFVLFQSHDGLYYCYLFFAFRFVRTDLLSLTSCHEGKEQFAWSIFWGTSH